MHRTLRRREYITYTKPTKMVTTTRCIFSIWSTTEVNMLVGTNYTKK